MSGVATYDQPDNTTQVGAAYKNAIDASTAALQQQQDGFMPHESAPPAMTVTLDSGKLENDAGDLVEVAQQVTATIVAPAVDPRNDLVVIDNNTGIAELVTGAEAGVPVDPPLPSGKRRIARARLQTGTTAIDNTIIDNIAVSRGAAGGGWQPVSSQDFDSGTTLDIELDGEQGILQQLELIALVNTTRALELQIQLSIDGGTTFNDPIHAYNLTRLLDGSVTYRETTGLSSIALTWNDLTNTAVDGIAGTIDLRNVAESTQRLIGDLHLFGYQHNPKRAQTWDGQLQLNVTTAATHLRLLWSGGDAAGGTVILRKQSYPAA